jgi:hypothetical protein
VAYLAVAAAVAVVVGGLLVTAAARRVSFLTGVLVVLVLLPLCGRPFPTSAGWALAAGAHLVATLLGGLLLWIGLRAYPSGLSAHEWLPPRSWVLLLAAATALGVIGWPLLAEAFGPTLGDAARGDWLEPARWSLGAGLAALTAGASLVLGAPEPPRIAAGAALIAAAGWLVGMASGAPVADVTLVATGLMLPCAASVAAWRSLREA